MRRINLHTGAGLGQNKWISAVVVLFTVVILVSVNSFYIVFELFVKVSSDPLFLNLTLSEHSMVTPVRFALGPNWESILSLPLL